MTGELAIVTGTSGGLGMSIVERLLRDGLRVVGISRRPVLPDAFGSRDGGYAHLCWDLSDIGRLKALADTIVRDHGSPYALVNNAAVGADGLLPTMHDSQIEAAVRTNLTSPMILTKYLIRPMLSVRRGRIVNISSIVARTGYRGLAVYGATKAGIEGFTRSLARDVGPRGVTVNAVAPGFLDTEMTGGLDGGTRERIQRRSALGRFAKTSEVAALVSLLVSEEGAGMTGSVHTVDGGSTA